MVHFIARKSSKLFNSRVISTNPPILILIVIITHSSEAGQASSLHSDYYPYDPNTPLATLFFSLFTLLLLLFARPGNYVAPLNTPGGYKESPHWG